MKKAYLIIAMLIAMVSAGYSQQIRGTIKDKTDGTPLIGASVVVKGTTIGSVSDADGAFEFTAPKGATTLVVSYVGYLNTEVALNGQSVIDIMLQSDATILGDVVVIGYGSQKRAKLSSSISSVNGDAVSGLATPSFDQQLAGRAAGVQVTVGSGIIGQAPRIRIRGTNSITSGGSPLIVVDGVPVVDGNQSGVTPTNPLADINPMDIESYEILKDGAATAIYGSRASNGVILITTKKGKRNSGLKTSFDTRFGLTNAISRFDLLNSAQFVEIANEKIKNVTPTAADAALNPDNIETDWQGVIFRQGRSQDYNLNFSGGTEKTNYYFSVGLNDFKGPVVANSQRRYSFSTTLEHNLVDWLKTGVKVQVSRTQNEGLNTGSNALSGNLTGAARLFPNVPVFDPSNPTGYNLTSDGALLGSGKNLRNIDNNYTNLGFVLANNQNKATTNRILSNAFVQINPLSWLELKSQIGVDYNDVRSFLSWDPRHGDGRGSNGIINQVSRNITRWNWQTYANAVKDFGNHSIALTAGVEYQKQEISSFTAGGSNFSDRFFLQEGLVTGSYSTSTSSGTFVPTGFDSYFGRISYDYGNRYLINLSARNDGISSLPIANRRGTFFGGGVAYRLSEEEFYKQSKLHDYVNNVKLRFSYAQVGNVDIGSFPYLGLYGAAQYGTQNGIGFSTAGNSELKWESSAKENYGLDLGLFKDRVNLTVDYFRNNVDGLILNAPTPPSLGVPNNSISKNVGSMINKGWEFALDFTPIEKNGFRWNVNLNYSMVKNNILSLNKGTDGKDQPIIPSSYHIIRVGEQIASFYGYEYAGVNSANGFPLFLKGDGRTVQRDVISGAYSFYNAAEPTNVANTTGAALLAADVKDGGDRKVLGVSNPTWFGGITNSFSYKGFDFEIFGRFSGGNQIMNVTRQETLLNQDFNNNGTEILNRWKAPGDITDVPRLAIGRGNNINLNGNATSRFVENADFFRIQNIILGYSLPKIAAQKMKLSSLRVYAQVQNALTFTSYSGLDPELNSNGDVNQTFGLDYNTNPQVRNVVFGINIGF